MADNTLDPVTYIQGRKKYHRPSGMLWSENSGTLLNGLYIPQGYEIGAAVEGVDPALLNQFLLITDDNRGPLSFSEERIEKRERMINGRMRSYHIADKITLSTTWNLIPSRSHDDIPTFNIVNGVSPNKSYTTDGGAGGADMLEWYNSHKGSFWVFLTYDNKGAFKTTAEPYDHLAQYNQVVEMFISDFSYSVEKRGTKFDFWNVSITLEEV
jgi:hypothetical protein